jgi:hypothetical protein
MRDYNNDGQQLHGFPWRDKLNVRVTGVEEVLLDTPGVFWRRFLSTPDYAAFLKLYAKWF